MMLCPGALGIRVAKMDDDKLMFGLLLRIYRYFRRYGNDLPVYEARLLCV